MPQPLVPGQFAVLEPLAPDEDRLTLDIAQPPETPADAFLCWRDSRG